MELQNEETTKDGETLVCKSADELRHLVRKFLKDDHVQLVVTVSVSEEKGEDENGKS